MFPHRVRDMFTAESTCMHVRWHVHVQQVHVHVHVHGMCMRNIDSFVYMRF